MEDLNDIYFFASVVQHGGFSAAARKIGVEKTRLSRRIAALEKRLGVRLLQRTTRALALTEAGQRFFERCVATVDGAQAAYDSVAELRREPAGLVRLSSNRIERTGNVHVQQGLMARWHWVCVFALVLALVAHPGAPRAQQTPEATTAIAVRTAIADGVSVQYLTAGSGPARSEEHTSELQSHSDLVCRLLLEKKKQ